MEVEIKNFIKVWLSVFASLSYCYFIGRILPKGKIRFLTILPIICLFVILPLSLKSVHFVGITAFFIVWLANFKLLLFSFGQGPLSTNPSISLLHFISLTILPIKIQQHPSHQNLKIKETPSQSPLKPQNKPTPSHQITSKSTKSPLNYAVKGLLLASIIGASNYSQHIHPSIILLLYCFHLYFALEIIFAMFATFARAVLGVELEPQFNEPYLATSLQDFWGRRWNLVVSSILRPAVYEPIRDFTTQIFGRTGAALLGILCTFGVSGLMHELIFYYLGIEEPTWEITGFFLLHGVCLAVEVALKKAFAGKYQVPKAVSGPLAVGFVLVTGYWLFLPQLLRCHTISREIEEYARMKEYVTHMGGGLRSG
ncbi:hypothetical protein HHK36_003346 [Tetracentron sinense]|uniref:Wax synthase domain-containing protein n=1 Tax=Tetracentron sinense TaxID=13715 RepID=A0A835DS40_TETSI|nr:hypothetical protein HHK36_003346 [Tetracentron sinense]